MTSRPFLQFFFRLFWWCLVLVALAATLGTLSPWLAYSFWSCELASHFQVQYVVILTLAAALFAVGRRFAWATAALGVALAATYVYLLPLYMSPPKLIDREISERATPLRIVSANIAFFNSRQSMLIDLVVHEQPDVVLLYEVSPDWLDTLKLLQATLPHHKIHPREGHPGLAIFSRVPLEHVEIVNVGQVPSPAVVARLKMPGGSDTTLTLVGTHPNPPVSADATLQRNDQIAWLIDLINDQPRPLAVTGDFNTTSWNPIFTRLLRDTNLRDSRLGFGVSASWHSQLPPLRIPIDHCLLSDEIIVQRREVGPYIGSDHYPLVIELVVP
jgi:endonuclease/exonuclease/phosphatase (EEP) superfamily protein YafD